MNRLGLVALVASVLVACSHPKPPVTPLPPDKPAEPVAKAEPAPPPAKPAPEPPKPAPHDTEIAAMTTTVKLVSPGKGKRVVAKIAPAAGAKTPVELHLDFTPTQDGQTQATPTMILRGDAEVTSADKAVTQYKVTVTGTDTHYPAGMQRLAQLDTGLSGIVGMTATGGVASNGVADKLALHHDSVTPIGAQMMELLKVTWLPIWPVLPAEAIAPGAKWQAATTFKLEIAEGIEVTETVDYELVAYKDKTWTIKGTSTLSGKDQPVQGAQMTAITGTGSMEATLVDGALIATAHGKLSVALTAQAQGQSLKLGVVLENSVGAGSSPSAALDPKP